MLLGKEAVLIEMTANYDPLISSSDIAVQIGFGRNNICYIIFRDSKKSGVFKIPDFLLYTVKAYQSDSN